DILLTSIGAAGLSVLSGGDGESLTLETAATGTVAISDSMVQRTGNGAIVYDGLAVLIVNGTAGADTFNVHSTAGGTDTTIQALGGTDFFGDIALTTIGAAGLAIHAGGNGETLKLEMTVAGATTVTDSRS